MNNPDIYAGEGSGCPHCNDNVEFGSRLIFTCDEICRMPSQVWEKFEEPKTQVVVEETTERKTNYKHIVVTEVGKELDFYAQLVESGKLTDRLTPHA